MAHGTVKWYNKEKGFGFISPISGEGDIFVRKEGVVDHPLEEKQKVYFEIGRYLNGNIGAFHVKKI